MPAFDTDQIILTGHALEQYRTRRRSNDADRGCRRLLGRAAEQPVPPVTRRNGRSGRLYDVGEFRLILDVELTTLITLFRRKGRTPLSHQWIDGRRAH